MNDNILDDDADELDEDETDSENESDVENVAATNAPIVGLQYPDPEAYRKATNKRFRMTKAEKQRGISRQQAFVERFSNPKSTT